MIRAFCLALAITFTSASFAFAQAQWRLADADQIASDTYLILTVPLNEAPALAAVAESIEAAYNVVLAAEWPLNSIGVHCLVMNASASDDIDGLIADLESDDRVRTVQRMQEFDVLSDGYQDPYFPLQHALTDLNIVAAHARSRGAGVVIGVVDSAIDTAHPDLQGRLIDAKDFVSRGGKSDAEAHGTAVAGVIAANADGAIGMIGVAPESSILGLRACWQPDGAPGRCSSFSLARAVNFAILNDVAVLNMSVGGPRDPLLEELLQAAVDAGLVVVAATGETAAVAFPASMPDVIAAGRRELGGIPAPATDVISAAPDAQYSYVSGSSVATAHVSGVVALLLAQQANLKLDVVVNALKSATDMSAEKPMLDAQKALAAVSE